MEGTFNVLSSSVELTQGQILKHCTDNKNVERVFSVGSRTPELQELVIDIFRLCIQYTVPLKCKVTTTLTTPARSTQEFYKTAPNIRAFNHAIITET